MTPLEAARACAKPVERYGIVWMGDPQVVAVGSERGIAPWSFYTCGRGGVLGDGPADAMIAAFGFMDPDRQRKAWERGAAVLPPTEQARLYAQACADWGSRHFATVPTAGRVADLLVRVTDAVEAAGMPLFAGWRAIARTVEADDAGRLGLALQVAREHRGSAHLVAVAAAGVSPVQAVASGKSGVDGLAFLGWGALDVDPQAGREAMAAVEDVTDRIVAPAFAALDETERAELVEAVRGLPG